jgi:8-amino-7-oxononanoate synthase
MTKLFEQIEQGLTALDEQDLRRRRRITSSPSGAMVEVDGRNMLSFCSFDYLGLAAHPKIQLALQEGAALYGLGSGASHLISGHSIAHEQLETRLAAMQSPHLEKARALYFGTGYMANLAVLSGLAASGGAVNGQCDTEIFSEKLNHASLIDGAKLARCKVSIYPHADLNGLETLLQQSNAKTKIVATDGVFSMDGFIAPLPEILALCERYDAWLVVDDAHGFGVLGDGVGILAHFNLRSKNLVYMGTLGKAAGVSGAFVAANENVIEWLIQKARPYIYTTASPPALAHALLTSLDIICGAEGAQRRSHLQSLTVQFKAQFKSLIGDLSGLSLMNSETQIQPLIVGKNFTTMQLAAQLYESGIWVPAIRPPTVPVGTARLRISLSAAHSSEQVSTLLHALHGLQKKAAE